jgi:hypothetical protein
MHTPCAGFSKTGARYRVPGIGYRLSGTWDLVPGTGAGPTPRAEHRVPKTGPAVGKRAHGVGNSAVGRYGNATIIYYNLAITHHFVTPLLRHLVTPSLPPGAGFSVRPSAWTKDAGRSYLLCPSSRRGRGPNTEHQGPSQGTGYRKTRPSGLQAASSRPRGRHRQYRVSGLDFFFFLAAYPYGNT